jgi:hypothetical protein
MTTKQRSELDHAIERAAQHSIEVTGRGFRKNYHAVLFTTNSASEENRWHIAIASGSRLVCDCRSRKICAHRAAVHIDLTVAAAKREAFAARVAHSFELDADRAAAEETAQAERDAANDRRDADRWELIDAGNW